jgi:hypothetical protein
MSEMQAQTAEATTYCSTTPLWPIGRATTQAAGTSLYGDVCGQRSFSSSLLGNLGMEVADSSRAGLIKLDQVVFPGISTAVSIKKELNSHHVHSWETEPTQCFD